jgi:hypothetical protein
MNPGMYRENRESTDEGINNVAGASGTHQSMRHRVPLRHSLFVMLAERCVRSGQAVQYGGHEHTPHYLDPRIFPEPDRIKTLPTPSTPLLQYLHII